MSRPVLAAILALLLILACRIHVTIWLAGHPVARPPIAGLILVASAAACAAVWVMAIRAWRGSRSSPCIRTRFAT